MKKQRYYRPIGEHFTYNGVELEVVEQTKGPYCGDEEVVCYFIGGECVKCSKFLGHCCNHTRDDGKDIIFKKVKS